MQVNALNEYFHFHFTNLVSVQILSNFRGFEILYNYMSLDKQHIFVNKTVN